MISQSLPSTIVVLMARQLYDRKYDFNSDDMISIEDLFYIAQNWLWFSQQ